MTFAIGSLLREESCDRWLRCWDDSYKGMNMKCICSPGPLARLAGTALLGAYLLLHGGQAVAQERIDRADLAVIFDEQKLMGAFALYDLQEERLILVNPDRAAERKYPASTFKIANSLIALETGVVADEEEVIPFGGKPQPIKAWERDMSMRDAIRISNVPVYQELARRIGRDRYLNWLDKFDFGNREIGADVTTFWLKGPLAVSAIEQVGFLARLADGRLPVSQRARDIVADIATLETGDGWTFYGKSGWSVAPDPDIGWFVGWVKTADGVYTFALNIDMKTRSDRDKRLPLVKRFLHALDIL